MGRPKGSKNKPKSNDLKLDGGEWLRRNIEKRDISGLPKLDAIEIPSKKNAISNEELVDMVRENGVAYMVELFPSNRIEDEKVSEMWKECQQKLIQLKKMIFND